MAVSSSPTMNVYLIGKQGCGKSATGNTLLRRKEFPSKASSVGVTTKIQRETIHVHNRQVNIWDGPGVTEVTHQTEEIVDWLKDTKLSRKSEGHVILWVARYGELCGEDDQILLKELNKKLGKSFVKANTVIVLTHIDNFDSDVEESGLTFDDWVKQQTGFFKDLCSMCNHKVLPVKNRSKSEEQVQQIFHCLLTAKSVTGGDSDFEMIEHPTKPLTVGRELPIPPNAPCGRSDVKQKATTPYPGSAKKQNTKDVTMKDMQQGGSDVIAKVKQQVDDVIEILSMTSCQLKLSSLGKVREELKACSGILGEKRDLLLAIKREVDREIDHCLTNMSRNEQTKEYLASLSRRLQSPSQDPLGVAPFYVG